MSSTSENNPIPAKIARPWGWEIWYGYAAGRYISKLLFIKAGSRTSLHKHTLRTETLLLVTGECKVLRGTDTLTLRPWHFVHITPDTIHRLEAISDSQIIEASTTEFEDLIRLHDDFGRLPLFANGWQEDEG